jgi:hypothetical protein
VNERENAIGTGTVIVIVIVIVQTGIKIEPPKSDEPDQITKNPTLTLPRLTLTLDNSHFNPVGKSLSNLHPQRIKWTRGNKS